MHDADRRSRRSAPPMAVIVLVSILIAAVVPLAVPPAVPLAEQVVARRALSRHQTCHSLLGLKST